MSFFRSAAKAGAKGHGHRPSSSCATLGFRLRANTAVVVALVLLCPLPATAQTQTQMNQQAGAAYARADAAMNAQWKRTYAKMKQREVAGDGFAYAAALLNSQRAWLAFRDAQCRIAAAEFQGGSLQPMAQRQCLAALSVERTRQLKGLMWQQ